MRPYAKLDSSQSQKLKKLIKNNPGLSFREFIKKYPAFKIKQKNYEYRASRTRQELGIQRQYNKGSQKVSKLFSNAWQIPCKEFENDPIKGTQNFLSHLNHARKTHFELVKIEKRDLHNDDWIPHYEIREAM